MDKEITIDNSVPTELVPPMTHKCLKHGEVNSTMTIQAKNTGDAEVTFCVHCLTELLTKEIGVIGKLEKENG